MGKLQEPIKLKKEGANNKFTYLILALIVAITFIVFWPAHNHQFVNWDDQVYVQEQPLVLEKNYSDVFKQIVSLNYHPITMLSLVVQANPDETLSATPFITWNIMLHILNTLLTYLFILLLCNKSKVALGTAILFAIHPMHVESVVWVSERKDVLYVMFLLASCISYLKFYNSKQNLWLLASLALFTLSCLSKAMAVCLPVLLMLIDFWKGGRAGVKTNWVNKIPFFAIALLFGLIALNVQSGGDFYGLLTSYGAKVQALATGVYSFPQKIQFALYGVGTYLIKFFIPMGLSAYYPYTTLNTLQGVVIPIVFVSMLIAVIWQLKNLRFLFFGFMWFCISVALVSQIISVGAAVMADRYTYLPYIGIAFTVSYFLLETLTIKNIKFGTYALVAFCGVLTYLCTQQVSVWQDSETLWTHALLSYPNDDLILETRGNYRGKNNNLSGALADFNAALSGGCNRPMVFEGLGNSYGTLSMDTKITADKRSLYLQYADSFFKQALIINPNNADILFNLAISKLGNAPTEAINYFTKALALAPYKEAAIQGPLGYAYFKTNQLDQAIACYTKAIALDPKNNAHCFYLGQIYLSKGDKANALVQLQKAQQLNPNDVATKNLLAQLLK